MRLDRRIVLGPAGIVSIYAVSGVLWIVVTGVLLVADDPVIQRIIESAKGFALIAGTSVLLYLLLTARSRTPLGTPTVEGLPSAPGATGLMPIAKRALPVVVLLGLAVPVVALSVYYANARQSGKGPLQLACAGAAASIGTAAARTAGQRGGPRCGHSAGMSSAMLGTPPGFLAGATGAGQTIPRSAYGRFSTTRP